MSYNYVSLSHDKSKKRSVCGQSEPSRRSIEFRFRLTRDDAPPRQTPRDLRTSGAPLRRTSARFWQSRSSFSKHCVHYEPSSGTHRTLERPRKTQRAYAQFDHLPGSRGVPEPHTRRPTTWPRKVGGSKLNPRLTGSLMYCSARPTASSSPNVAA